MALYNKVGQEKTTCRVYHRFLSVAARGDARWSPRPVLNRPPTVPPRSVSGLSSAGEVALPRMYGPSPCRQNTTVAGNNTWPPAGCQSTPLRPADISSPRTIPAMPAAI